MFLILLETDFCENHVPHTSAVDISMRSYAILIQRHPKPLENLCPPRKKVFGLVNMFLQLVPVVHIHLPLIWGSCTSFNVYSQYQYLFDYLMNDGIKNLYL